MYAVRIVLITRPADPSKLTNAIILAGAKKLAKVEISAKKMSTARITVRAKREA